MKKIKARGFDNSLNIIFRNCERFAIDTARQCFPNWKRSPAMHRTLRSPVQFLIFRRGSECRRLRGHRRHCHRTSPRSAVEREETLSENVVVRTAAMSIPVKGVSEMVKRGPYLLR